jgi:hypothetical protein
MGIVFEGLDSRMPSACSYDTGFQYFSVFDDDDDDDDVPIYCTCITDA